MCPDLDLLHWARITSSASVQIHSGPLNSGVVSVTAHLAEDVGADWTSTFPPPPSPPQLRLTRSWLPSLQAKGTRWSRQGPPPPQRCRHLQVLDPARTAPSPTLPVPAPAVFRKHGPDALLLQVFAASHSKTCGHSSCLCSCHFLFPRSSGAPLPPTETTLTVIPSIPHGQVQWESVRSHLKPPLSIGLQSPRPSSPTCLIWGRPDDGW